MQNCNRETKLIYRTLGDKFFVINKPVNWTLTRKKAKREEEGGGRLAPTGKKPSPPLSKSSNITKSVEETDCPNDKRRSSLHTKKHLLSQLKKLSSAEKNAFLYTNSALYLYNDFNFNLRGNSTEHNRKDKIAEKHYVESLLNCETNGAVYYPYKLPTYMSGLVICCRDLLIYKKFLQMIGENKLVRKYRCLVNNPFVFVEGNKVEFLREEPSRCSYAHRSKNEGKNKIDGRKAILFIRSLQAQKQVSDMFPYHNFFADNPYSSSYCYRLAELTIDEWKGRVHPTTCRANKEGNNKHRSSTPHRGGRCTTSREENPLHFDHFVSAFLRRSPPVKSLNRFLSNLLSNGTTLKGSGEYDLGHEKELQVSPPIGQAEQEKHKHGNPSVSLPYGGHFPYDVEMQNGSLSKDGKIKFPLSLYFNEGNFFTLDKRFEDNSVPVSMVYRVESYRDYLRRNAKALLEEGQGVNLALDKYCNVFIIQFILLENAKPDLVRHFFSEMKTPIINDNIFDGNSFKRDVIGEVILEQLEGSHADSSPRVGGSPLFDVDTHLGVALDDAQSTTWGLQNRDGKVREYLLKARAPHVNAFTIPGAGVAPQGPEQQVHQVQNVQTAHPSNFIIQESPRGRNDEEGKLSSKNANLCLELFQLQFLDPISGDHVKIENSLPSAWL
ncbi:hypothetical protein PVNG_00991 [Plasmodium vivax North Korean]|uniref:Uncharacterized protein n=1 Tax=Plasmodium vivax North Korean TaxID=1035514 RepID=A0A0J9TY38_PLAVI|nr:hypothetical protein PVNG_00991 [Plasmodium vivax North Korean]